MKGNFANYKNNANEKNFKVHILHIKLTNKSLTVIYIASNGVLKIQSLILHIAF